MEAKKIIPLWQPVGFSTHLLAQRLGEKLGKKTAHTGTLDPMAEGVIVVLVGDERYKKKAYSAWKKRYFFEVTFGLATDTYDGMGLVTEKNFNNIRKKDLISIVNNLRGEYEQKLPIYSTKKISGKHLYEYARLGESVERPDKKGKIFSFTLENFKEVNAALEIENQINKIKMVHGDFRQKEIINNWKKILKAVNSQKYFPKTLQKASFRVETSSGIYIRSLSQDIAVKLERAAFCSQIVREKNGRFSQRNSHRLEKYFTLKEINGSYLQSQTLII